MHQDLDSNVACTHVSWNCLTMIIEAMGNAPIESTPTQEISHIEPFEEPKACENLHQVQEIVLRSSNRQKVQNFHLSLWYTCDVKILDKGKTIMLCFQSHGLHKL